MNRKALGKGLEALFTTTEALALVEERPREDTKGIKMIEVKKIKGNPYQPRQNFEEEKLKEMATSIKEKGILQPILLRAVDDGYEIIAGERRFRAAGMAGLEAIPAIVIKATDREQLEMGLIENLQREDLNPIEQARGFKLLQEEFGLSQEEVAGQVGLSREAVTNTLRLLQLPLEIREEIEKGRLTAGHGRILLRIEKDQERVKLAKLAIEKGVSVREMERLIESRMQRRKERRKKGIDVRFEIKCHEAEEELLEVLETLVKVKPLTKQRGKIEIYFQGEEELKKILNRFGT